MGDKECAFKTKSRTFLKKSSELIEMENKFSKFSATKKQLAQLKELVDGKVSETEIDSFLSANPELFAFALHGFQTGHHGIVVLPKQQIKAKSKIEKDDYGLIPDFLVAGENSDGFQWWVIELKGINQNIFIKDGNSRIALSETTNKGIIQLLEYIDFCNKYQSNLRDAFGLEDFREPNGILIMGHEDEFKDKKKKAIKASWNRMHQKKLEIRTFSWLLREFVSQDTIHNFKLEENLLN